MINIDNFYLRESSVVAISYEYTHVVYNSDEYRIVIHTTGGVFCGHSKYCLEEVKKICEKLASELFEEKRSPLKALCS